MIVLYFCLANCAVFKVRRETDREDIPARSLKTQQRAGHRATREGGLGRNQIRSTLRDYSLERR